MLELEFDLPFKSYDGNEPFIFVSSSYVNDSLAFEEIVWLYKQGYRIRYAEGENSGYAWAEEIAQALNSASVYIVFLTHSTVDSRDVRNEIFFASRREKSIIAVYFEDIKLPLGLEFLMGDTRHIRKNEMDLTRYENVIINSLSRELIDPDRKFARQNFVFKYIIKMDDRSIQKLLREVDNKELAFALKNASEELKNKILSNMSNRCAEMISEELDYMGPVRLSEVEEIQQGIINKLARLEEEGEINLDCFTDDEMV